MATVLLGQFEPCVTALGPGRRAAVWVQGCPFRCPGCCSPHFHAPGRPEQEIAVEALIGLIQGAQERHGVAGISLSGGEPFAQAAALAPVARACQQLGLSVLAWTGYTLEQLTGRVGQDGRVDRNGQAPPSLGTADRPPPGTSDLLANLDVLIDGPFRQERPPAPLRGSDNQRIHRLTDRYAESDLTSRTVEVRIRPDCGTQAFGIVPDWWAAACRLFGLELKPEAPDGLTKPDGLELKPEAPDGLTKPDGLTGSNRQSDGPDKAQRPCPPPSPPGPDNPNRAR